MPLTELKALIQGSYRPNYYGELLKNYTHIIEAVENTSQREVAKDLGMNEPKFSVLFHLLLAYAEEKSNADT